MPKWLWVATACHRKALVIQLMFTTKQGVSELLEAKKRISELESFRTAYMEWGDKTDWVQGDKRFDVLIPFGANIVLMY